MAHRCCKIAYLSNDGDTTSLEVIQEINADGTTVLLVEQNVRQAIKISHYAYVMETGRVVLHGKSTEIARDSRVMEAYLGGRKVG